MTSLLYSLSKKIDYLREPQCQDNVFYFIDQNRQYLLRIDKNSWTTSQYYDETVHITRLKTDGTT